MYGQLRNKAYIKKAESKKIERTNIVGSSSVALEATFDKKCIA